MLLNKNKEKNKEKRTLSSIESKEIISFNTQYLNMSPYVESTVVKISDNIIKSNLTSKENRFLGEQYLLNYKTNNDYIGYKIGISNFIKQEAIATATNLEFNEELEDIIKLPIHTKVKVALSTAIINRRSVRKFSGNSMHLKDLSNILYYSQGISAEVPAYGSMENKNLKLRNAPSAGGLYPIELYLYINNVKDLEDGIYRYYPYAHALKKVSGNMNEKEIRSLAEFAFINAEKANVIVFYIYNLPINTRKYGDAGMAYAFIETGEIAQNLQLVSTALAYGACDIGGYEKQHVEEILGLDGVLKHMIHMTLVGVQEE